MLVCWQCKCPVSANIRDFFKHLKAEHGLNNRNDRYICCQGHCARSFTEKYSFSRHLSKCHPEDLACEFDINSCVPNRPSALTNTEKVNEDETVCEMSDFSSNDGRMDHAQVIRDFASRFICSARSRAVALDSVYEMVNACSELVAAIVENLHDDVVKLRQHVTSPDPTEWDQLEAKFMMFREPFAGLNNEYLFTQHLTKAGVLVQPEEYIIGQGISQEIDRNAHFSKPVVRKITGQYVPIRKMLIALSEKTELINSAIAGQMSDGSVLCSFFDGDYWKRHPLGTIGRQQVIVLRLYGDDFEPANPLGPHRTAYKLCCIYYQLEGLSAREQSKVENIFMAVCFHSDDVKSFGWSAVLKPLVDELKSLESDGLDLMVDGHIVNCKVTLSCVTGDNLFLNGVLGFVESFSANFPCRQCTVHKNDFQNVWLERTDLVRSIASYDEAIACVAPSSTGIKNLCPLNELSYFHATTNYVQDIMHDILEGICAYDMSLISKRCIADDCFTLAQLNGHFQNLNYGYHDMPNRPPAISSFDGDSLPFGAAEIWCYTRYLPIAIGEFVAPENEVWLFYMMLRRLMDIIFSPTVTIDELELLRVLIAEYLETRVKLFPCESLKNKHHHLVHYPRIIQQMGPLVRLWCMRFEQKHQRYKRLMHVTNNFKNVPKTVTTRHQNDVAALLINSQRQTANVVLGPGKVETVIQLKNGNLINEAMGGNCLHFDFYIANWAEVSGTKFKPGCYLVVGNDTELGMPIFVQLENILSRNQGGDLIFICEKLHTVEFSDHFHAWSVERCFPKQFVAIDSKTLVYFIPNALQTVDGYGCFIVLRHRL